MRKPKVRPRLDYKEPASRLRFAKPQYQASADVQMDTSGMKLRKIQPMRDKAYLRWITFRPCAIEGKTNQRTDIRHICWSPAQLNGRFKSDPAHANASYSGRLKRNDT